MGTRAIVTQGVARCRKHVPNEKTSVYKTEAHRRYRHEMKQHLAPELAGDENVSYTFSFPCTERDLC